MTQQIKRLYPDDHAHVLAMETGIKDDYVKRIFPQLAANPQQLLYGLFDSGTLQAAAGCALLPNGCGMLGRLRSDIRFHSKGNATRLLQKILQDFSDNGGHWCGAITRTSNTPARRVLDKLGLKGQTAFLSLQMENTAAISAIQSPPWTAVTSLAEKRDVILQHAQSSEKDVFPYEAYFPMPFSPSILTDEYLEELDVFQSPDQQRSVYFQKDFKGTDIVHIKYFWDDLFHQSGLWRTLSQFLEQHPLHIPIVDAVPEAAAEMPLELKHAFKADDDPWILYGKYL